MKFPKCSLELSSICCLPKGGLTEMMNPQKEGHIIKFVSGKQMQNDKLQIQSNQKHNPQQEHQAHPQINLAIVSDFYYPFVGGVEIHIKQLAIHLNSHPRINKVIVITHKYSDDEYIGQQNHHGFKVYYINIHYSKDQMITFPTYIFNFSTARRILLAENINLVHCHQSSSTLGLEFMYFSAILGIRVILTEHSLYGFRSILDIHFNRVAKAFFPLCYKIIAVSKTTRNNIIARSGICKSKLIVIPNGVADVRHFKKNRIITPNSKIKIITVGRMTFRRGTDLLIEILPELCKKHSNIQLLIVGDGVKRKAMQKIVEREGLHEKVKLLGIIADHDQLLQLMGECHIFLNTPLTQSFGIALAEAAMLGLYCVSTNVGGVQETVPSQYLFTSKANPQSLLLILFKVIHKIRKMSDPMHADEKFLCNSKQSLPFEYKWADVCEKTVEVYDTVMKIPIIKKRTHLLRSIKKGHFFEIFFCITACLLLLFSLTLPHP